MTLNRRELLHLTAATGSLSAVAADAPANDSRRGRFEIIDTNISLFRWPFADCRSMRQAHL